MTTTALKLDDVHMVFQRAFRPPVWALRGLTLEVERGAVLGLLGPNGAGKTTCLSCCLGLLSPQSGAVYVDGERVSPARPLRSCGVLLEDTRLPPFLTVRNALGLACRLRHIAPGNGIAKVDAIVSECGLGDLLDRPVRALSKGQARRVGLAAALLGDPALLVLDEPSAGLDAEARVDFERIVRSVRGLARTSIIASHLLGDVESTCTDLAIVHHGRVALFGKASDLLRDARYGHGSNVHVEQSCTSTLDRIGIQYEPSSYPGLVLLKTVLPEEELFAALASARVVPRRVEPRVSVLSVYLEATREET